MDRIIAAISIGITTLLMATTVRHETQLSEARKAVLFGGAPAKTGTCCLPIETCNVATDSCSNYYDQKTTCLSKNQIVFQAQYAKGCLPPDVANPNYDCKDYATDSNDKPYYCVAVFVCLYNDLTRACYSGNPDVSKCISGKYTCASNCP